MNIHHFSENLPTFKNAIVATGTFDGVHTAHKTIIAKILQLAQEQQGESVIVTFHPHPRLVLEENPENLSLLTTLDEKLQLLEKENIHQVVIVPFTKDFAGLNAEEYVRDFLVKNFSPHTIVIGYNHHFGKNRTGNVAFLNSVKDQYGFEVMEIEKQMEDAVSISSTHIRKALFAGEVEHANQLLGYPYLLSGKVVEGKKLGATIGFPTANIATTDIHKLVPADGVYAVEVTVKNKTLGGMMNIGFRPTVNGTHRTLEVNIFNFHENIYGENISIHFIKRLRNEKKFNGIDELKNQLAQDQLYALEVLGKSHLS